MNTSKVLGSLGGLLLFASSCASAEGQVVMVELQGSVLDGWLGEPVPDAEVTLYMSTGVSLGTARTDKDGQFRISAMEIYETQWDLSGEIRRDGYVPTSFHQRVQVEDWRAAAVDGRPAHIVEPTLVGMPPLLIARETEGLGDLSGRVFDALYADQAQGLHGFTVEIREGLNAPETEPVLASTLTLRDTQLPEGEDDNYSLTGLPPGSYTISVIGAPDYIGAHINTVALGNRSLPNRDLGLSPVLGPGEFRVVLTWGESPSDLDSHITGPMPDDSEFTEFHVYYNAGADPDGGAVCFLDVDDTSSYGPETVTVYEGTTGSFRYAVHDYSNRSSSSSSALSTSGARVQLFYDRDKSEVFEVPSGQLGTVWEVFELQPEDGQLFTRNRFSNESSPAAVLGGEY